MKIEKNVGTIDRVLRSGIIFIMIYCMVFVISDDFARVVLGLLASINILAVIFSNCPLYNLVGFSTCVKTGAQQPDYNSL